MSPARNTARTALAALGAVAVALRAGRVRPRRARPRPNGKAQFVAEVRLLPHAGARRHPGHDRPEPRHRLPRPRSQTGINRDTVEGVVHRQILHPRRDSVMPAEPREGRRRAATWPPTWATRPASKGQDQGALAQAGLAAGQDRPADLHRGRLRGLPHVQPGQRHRHDRPEPEPADDRGREHARGQDRRAVHPRVDPGPRRLHRQGLRPNAMPSFKGRLTDAQIKALIDFLLQKAPRRSSAGVGRAPAAPGRLALQISSPRRPPPRRAGGRRPSPSA